MAENPYKSPAEDGRRDVFSQKFLTPYMVDRIMLIVTAIACFSIAMLLMFLFGPIR